jgi:hypothetical protein
MATIQHPAFPEDTQQVKDPGPWVEQGWILLDDAEAEQRAHDLDPNLPVRPARNASREDWLAYALAQPNADEAFFAGKNRDEIRDTFVGD